MSNVMTTVLTCVKWLIVWNTGQTRRKELLFLGPMVSHFLINNFLNRHMAYLKVLKRVHLKSSHHKE